MRLSTRVVLLVLAIAACGSPSEPVNPPQRLRLAYTTTALALHVVDVDGTGDSIVTPRAVTWMAWSSTGLAAYYSHPSVYVLDTRTKGEIVVGSQVGSEAIQSMAWSPDGSKLMFVTGAQIHIVNADGSGAHTLSPTVSFDVTWSPDGKSLAYANNGVWIIGADGNGNRLLNSAGAERLRWSPDGNFIAAGFSDIRLFPLDGSPPHIVASPPCLPQCGSNELYGHPHWSSDGTMIAALVGTGLFAMNSDGGNFHTLVNAQTSLAPVPETAPIGPVIAYLSPAGAGNSGGVLHTVHFDGTTSRTITTPAPVDLFRWAMTR